MRVLSPDDGKQSIVHVAQQLCRSVENKERSFKDINVSMLDLLLRGSTLCLCATYFDVFQNTLERLLLTNLGTPW